MHVTAEWTIDAVIIIHVTSRIIHEFIVFSFKQPWNIVRRLEFAQHVKDDFVLTLRGDSGDDVFTGKREPNLEFPHVANGDSDENSRPLQRGNGSFG